MLTPTFFFLAFLYREEETGRSSSLPARPTTAAHEPTPRMDKCEAPTAQTTDLLSATAHGISTCGIAENQHSRRQRALGGLGIAWLPSVTERQSSAVEAMEPHRSLDGDGGAEAGGPDPTRLLPCFRSNITPAKQCPDMQGSWGLMDGRAPAILAGR